MRHAIVNKDGLVVNVIIWTGSEWMPPRDHYVVQDDTVNVGDQYDFNNKVFIKPQQISPDPS